eukprot:c20525_g1_i1 orf=1004-2071(+)
MLPNDLLEKIFSYLPVLYIARIRLVCKQWSTILSSQDFLMRYSHSSCEKWVAVFDELGLNEQRILVLYDASLDKWLRISLTFLPAEFTDAVAAAGGLLCLAGQLDGRNVMCVCNPLTKTYKVLPELNQELSVPVAVLVEGNGSTPFKVLVLSGDIVALHYSTTDYWLMFNTGLPYRPRSPVSCDGVIYGLQNMGSPWQASWRLVCSKLDQLGSGQVWSPLNRPEWGEILDILRQPRLLESNGCLFLTGGLRRSGSNDSCSTFIILKLDLKTLEWSEAARMPMKFYIHFNPGADFKIFGGRDRVYFSIKVPGRLVVCDFSDGEGSWRWVDNCPVFEYRQTDLYKGLLFHPRLDMCP